MPDGLETVKRFASALDNEDYATAESLLSDVCEYVCRGQLHRGPAAIIESYRKHGDSAKTFDSIQYESRAVREAAREFRIEFIDHITQAGRQFSFRCEQLIEVDDLGRIVRIAHVDLPGQVEALNEFKRSLSI